VACLANNLPSTPTFFSQLRILKELWARFMELRILLIPKDLSMVVFCECQVVTAKILQSAAPVSFHVRRGENRLSISALW
jgi:hypothetical protein